MREVTENGILWEVNRLLQNMKNAMSVKNISALAIATLIGTTEKTVNNKLNGVSDFTLPEAIKIRKNLFPEYDMFYLFEQKDRAS